MRQLKLLQTRPWLCGISHTDFLVPRKKYSCLADQRRCLREHHFNNGMNCAAAREHRMRHTEALRGATQCRSGVLLLAALLATLSCVHARLGQPEQQVGGS